MLVDKHYTTIFQNSPKQNSEKGKKKAPRFISFVLHVFIDFIVRILLFSSLISDYV